jgi:hypothetical protein
VVDDDVASLSSSLGSDNALGGDNLSGERGLDLPDIHRNGGLVIVRLGLEEILGGDLGATENKRKTEFLESHCFEILCRPLYRLS